MNVIGEIGNFIMIYQDPLQVASIAILVVAVIICIGKAIANAGKKRRALLQIHEMVTEINENVKTLSEKRTEVICIDGRFPQGTSVVMQGDAPVVATAAMKTTMPETCEQTKAPETEHRPAVKYFSRDCAVAKDGRQYTLEELNAQIRD